MPTPSPDSSQKAALRRFVIATSVLVLAFSLPLFELLKFSVQSQLYSHIVLIPCISVYLVRQKRASLPGFSEPQRILALLFLVAGLACLGGYGLARVNGASLAPVDGLALTTLSFLCFFASVCAWTLGRPLLRAVTFPLAFLIFTVPLPECVEVATETFLQYGSAYVAQGLFAVAGTTVFVEGLTFQLPTITLQIAPECSGIHSSLALFVTSIITGYFLLRSPVRRLVLALAVIPLALLRNGFRVFVIGELCVRKGPQMIDSYIHHHGGPIFFVLSLIPFFFLLALLIRSERKNPPKAAASRS